MNSRTPILIALTLAAFALPARAPVLAQTEERAAAAQVIGTVTLTAKEPAGEKPLETTRPRFRWAAESAPGDLTYDVVLWEVDAKAAGRDDAGKRKEPQIVFERRGLRETELAYPESGAPLDKTKFYAWAVIANDSKGNQVGRTMTPVSFLPFPPVSCPTFLVVWPQQTFSYCQQSSGNFSASNISFFFLPSNSGTVSATLTDPNNVSTSVNANCFYFGCVGLFSISWPATQPGTYQWTLTVQVGSCTISTQITLFIYPNLQAEVLDYYPGGSQIQKLCWGDDATLTMLDVNGNPSPAGCQVKWEYSANGSTWNPLGQGNPFNTNPITSANPLFNGLSCTGASITLQFRGTLDPNCLSFPPGGWPPSCPNVKTTSLVVDCPTQPGSIAVAPKTKICSNNTYPQTVNLTLSGHTGSVGAWTVNGNAITGSNGQTNISHNITSAGTDQFCVPVTNGACAPKPACVTVIVEDPIKGTIQVTPTQIPEICWGEDKVTMNFVPSTPLPPGTLLSWSYQINCTGPWTSSGVTGTTQNSNDVLLAPFYPPNINPCTANNVCWKVTATSGTGICLPVDIGPATINIIKPFNPTNAPVISPATVPIKCPGQPVTLTATNLSCATGPPSFQWYLDGLPLQNETSVSIQATDPGSYTVEVCNKNSCSCIETAPVIVRDCLTLVEIKGPCTCKDGDLVTLTASVSSQVIPGPPSNCGSPYTYLWSTGETTASIQVKCPAASQGYSVEVKDGTGCKTKASYTIKRCP